MEIKEKYWHGFFELGIFVKSITGLVEILSGTLLLSVGPNVLHNILMRLAGGEAGEVPQDFFFVYSSQYIQHLTTATKNFAGIYILAHGLLNLILIIGLIKQKTQAYLIAVGVLISFMLYQIFRIAQNHSLILTVLTVFDVFFVYVIWHEYNYLTQKLKNEALLKN